MKVGELFVQLGVIADSKNLKEFAKAIGDLPMDIVTGIAALAGLEYELTKVAAQAMETAVGFERFSYQTGLSWKELQRWQIVAEQANISTDAVASSVTALERNLADIRLGRGNIAPFQLLGIDTKTNAFGVLNQLRERLKGVDRPTAVNLISQMGLSPEMIRLLTMGNKEFEKLSKTVRGMTSGQVEDFLRAKQALVQFAMAFRNVMMDIVSHFTHAIEKSMEFKRILLVVGIAAASVAAYFFPITAALTELILILDDLATYFAGGDSVTGRAIAGLKKIGEEFSNTPLLTGMKKGLAVQNANPLGLGFAGVPWGAVQSLAGNKTVQNIFNVSVTGAGPVDAIAREVTRRIAEHMNRTEKQVDNQGH